MKTTARIVITKDCPRDCPKCCNKTKVYTDKVQTLDKLSDLDGKYDEIIITGGEPLLYPEHTFEIIKTLRHRHFYGMRYNLYLYTGIYHQILHRMIPYLDGLQYSLHYPMLGEMWQIRAFSVMLSRWRKSGKSFRLFIEDKIDQCIEVYPNLWNRITSGPMIDECPLPDNEDLFFFDAIQPLSEGMYE